MESRNCLDYIKIGLCTRLLMQAPQGASNDFIIKHIKLFEKLLEKIGFEVSLANIEKLVSFKEQLKDGDNSKLTDKDREELKSLLERFEFVVAAEAKTKNIYVLEPRRFNSKYLLNTPERLMKLGSFDKLNEIAKSDFQNACRCLLFGQATAAAFHILRTTEGVLKAYYFHHKKRNRLKKPMWAQMVTDLKNKKTNRPPQVLLDSIDNIRVYYRNPTQHPDEIYDLDTIQDLFGVCIDVIGKMASEL